MHPRATEAELACIEAAAPPRDSAEKRAAAEAALRQAAAAAAAASMREAELDALLKQADADGSGELELGEFCALMTRLGVRERAEQLALFNEADADGSGALSVPEFRAWWLARPRG